MAKGPTWRQPAQDENLVYVGSYPSEQLITLMMDDYYVRLSPKQAKELAARLARAADYTEAAACTESRSR